MADVNLPALTLEQKAADWFFGGFNEIPKKEAEKLNSDEFFTKQINLLDILRKSRTDDTINAYRLELMLYMPFKGKNLINKTP